MTGVAIVLGLALVAGVLSWALSADIGDDE